MLPLLPALILLLLQGPANIERMAYDGQLPAALNAIHRQMIHPEQGRITEGEEVLLASLLAVSNSRQMSQALWHLLSLAEVSPATGRTAPIVAHEASSPAPVPASLGSPEDGFCTSQRSRDGPF